MWYNMCKREDKHMKQDIYEDRNSKYCYKNTNTLINNLNIQDRKVLQKYEAKITAAKLLALRQKGIIGDFDVKHINAIHKFLFEDIYPFAGKFRLENIAKGVFRFAEWEYIEQELNRLLNKLKEEKYLDNLPKEKLAERLAYYLSELNVLHPYREGNGRTTREFIRELALKNGYILDLRKVSPKDFLNACIKSIVDTSDLNEYIYKCLTKK